MLPLQSIFFLKKEEGLLRTTSDPGTPNHVYQGLGNIVMMELRQIWSCGVILFSHIDGNICSGKSNLMELFKKVSFHMQYYVCYLVARNTWLVEIYAHGGSMIIYLLFAIFQK